MILILEGPDGGGKTTLATYLRAHYGWEYVHTGVPHPGEHVVVNYAATLQNAYLSRKNTVIDRLHLGERVYGPICRGVDLLGEEGLTILNRVIRAYDARVMICLPPLDQIKTVIGQRKKTEYVKDGGKLEQIYMTYLNNFAKIPTWDYTSTSYLEIARMAASTAQLPHALYDYVVGSRKPTFLFVGEKANQTTLDLPWVSLANSSHFLFEAIRDAGFHEDEIAFVNAFRITGEKNDLLAIWLHLGRPVVIALGDVAKFATNQLPTMGTRIFFRPHPAYWRRFQSAKAAEYTSILRAIRNDVLGLDRV